MGDFPDNYWGVARHVYFRDHVNGGFGVMDGRTVILKGPLDKNQAAAIALILNGDGDLARDLLAVRNRKPPTG
jgi:hypothetical protein